VIDGQPTDGAVLCGACVAKLQARLGHVPALVAELEVTITRQDRTTASKVGGRGSETPSPYNERASDTGAQLRDRLSLWARAVAEHFGASVPHAEPRNIAVVAAQWLMEHPWTVAGYPAAGDLFEEISDDVRAAFQVIDRPPDAVFAGRCQCGGLLYARPGHQLATCRAPDCGLDYGVEEMRTWMLGEIKHREGTATEVSAILRAVGIKISYTTIHRWHARGRLARADGYRPVYRVGDVVAVATGEEAA
jgi:hypothetical protein